MPELPEVECVRLGITEKFLGHRISDVWHDALDNLLDLQSEPLQGLRGQFLRALERRGKYMLWTFDSSHMLSHLGMSGVFTIDGVRARHSHLEISFDNGKLVYTDPRRFGYLNVQSLNQPFERWDVLGPDALQRACRAEYLYERARHSTVAVKVWIMDQGKIAGVGNIYACEALYRAGIHPQRGAGCLSLEEWRCLARALKGVMRASLRNRGTTFSDYRLTNGKGGSFQNFLKVFQKEGESCKVCGDAIHNLRLAGRSTFYCPTCQKELTL